MQREAKGNSLFESDKLLPEKKGMPASFGKETGMGWFEKRIENTHEVVCYKCQRIRKLGVWEPITEKEIEKMKSAGIKFIFISCDDCQRVAVLS